MKSQKVPLDIPQAMTKYARVHGAQKDITGHWFAEEPIAYELESFRIKVKRQRRYEFEPSCPLCGKAMVKRTSRSTQNQFWGCRAYPACRGTLDVDYTPSTPSSELALQGIEQAWFSPERSLSTELTWEKPSLKRRWEKIVLKAFAILGGKEKAMRWLESPNLQLKNYRPIDLLGSRFGCDAVEKLLDQRKT